MAKNTHNTEAGDQQKASRLQWRAVPSVTYGGKPSFFNTITDDYNARRSVVWNRIEKAWEVKGPQTLADYHGKSYGFFASDKTAKQFVEAGNAN